MPTKTTSRLRDILASNIEAAMIRRYRGLRSTNARIRKLMEETGLGKRTLQRALNPKADDHDVMLGTIEEIAKSLRCEAYELLKEPDPEPDSE